MRCEQLTHSCSISASLHRDFKRITAYRLTDRKIYNFNFKPATGKYELVGDYDQPDFIFDRPDVDKISIETLALQPNVTLVQPNALRKTIAVFEHLQTHESEPLKSTFELDVTLIDKTITKDDQTKETPALYARFEAKAQEKLSQKNCNSCLA